MQPDRREFLKHVGWLTATGAGVAAAPQALASAAGHGAAPPDANGVLVDLGACIGCRQCEYACKRANGFDAGEIESYDDTSVFAEQRRPAPDAFTVVNEWPGREQRRPVYAKVNCMHCNHPACVSACIVGALRKQENGAVTYDAWKCIGCRYCMVACPFQIPAYSYNDVLTPEVRKCEFCLERTGAGERPACVDACPRDVMIFGKRSQLLTIAHERIAKHPDRYIDHVYGEHEVGGTSWMYLSPVPFEQAGFLKLGTAPPGALTEAIQHGVFKYWIAPVAWYSFLAGAMWFTGRRAKQKQEVHVRAMRNRPLRLQHEQEHRLAARATAEGNGDSIGFGASAVALAEPPDEVEDLYAEDGHDDDDCHGHDHVHEHHHAEPVRQKLLTPGVWVLIAMVLTGVGFGLYRFIFGLAASTNLDQQHPWGLWIAMDVGSGIALAGGGFVTAALVHIFHREHYHAIARSALLMALLGYTFYVPGLLADIGRWYNIWHPTIPSMWQGNSVLFEVGLCVMIYLNVQYAELMPILCEPVMGRKRRFPRLARLAAFVHKWLEWMMPALLVLGVALSTFHQSSLGNLMVIAPYKLHELWWTPVMPIQFLLSAMMVGFPMVIFTILTASWSLKREPEMHVLSPLARYIPVFLVLYLGTKVGDVIVRQTYVHLAEVSLHSVMWIAEMVLVVVPLALLVQRRVRDSQRWLAAATLMVILGVVLNRLNVFVVAYHPPFAEKNYFPSITEFAVSLGLVAALMLTYRVAVTYLPILHPQPRSAS